MWIKKFSSSQWGVFVLKIDFKMQMLIKSNKICVDTKLVFPSKLRFIFWVSSKKHGVQIKIHRVTSFPFQQEFFTNCPKLAIMAIYGITCLITLKQKNPVGIEPRTSATWIWRSALSHWGMCYLGAECQIQMTEVLGSMLTRITFLWLDFLFSRSKASGVNIAIIVNHHFEFCMFVKNSIVLVAFVFITRATEYNDWTWYLLKEQSLSPMFLLVQTKPEGWSLNQQKPRAQWLFLL